MSQRIAVVTGGGSGIGRACARALAKTDFSVVLADVTERGMKDTADLISATGRDAMTVATDVRDRGSVQNLVGKTLDRFGRIDILVNSAGIFPLSKLETMAEDEWDRVIDTNLKGVFLCCQAVLPAMRARGWGRIVSIGTGRGTDGYDRGAHYSASKAGLIGLTKSLAIETRQQGITANIVSPGMTDTPQVRGQHSAEEIASFLAKRGAPLGKPEDVVGLLLYLASEEAGHVTGQVFTLRFP